LLYDGIRLMVRVLRKTKSLTGIKFINHCRRAKRHWFAALMAKNDEQRFPHYIALLKDVDETRVSLKNAQRYLEKQGENALWVADIIQLMALIEKVMSQATRRVVLDEQVPVEDKVVSLHEPHTDIIVKGGRDVQFGHKINLATGVSGLVTDVVIEAGNPADRIRLLPMLKRHKKLYGQVPKEVAVDGGYASQKNLRRANLLGVEAMAFDKRVNLSIEDMVGDEWLYRDLKRFRAGIEASISYLKRCFGMKRVLWKGLTQFKASIYLSVLSHNLVRWASTI
jgi:IS5 family transposase